MVWYSHLFKNFPQFVVIHRVKDFNVISEEEVEVDFFFFEFSMTNLGFVVKNRDITLLTKIHTVKAMFFPVIMYGCQSWTI